MSTLKPTLNPRKAALALRSLPVPLLALGALLLGGCANVAGPDYQAPEVENNEAWSLTTSTPQAATATIPVDWWTEFGDPYLDDLIRQALAGSFDMNILVARVEAAGLTLEEAERSNLPTVSLNAGTGITRANSESGATTSRNYSTSIGGLEWEFDLWGKVRKKVRAQKAEYRATEADYRAGYLVLVSDVASTYFTIREFDERIEAQRSALRKNRHITDLYRAQLKEGLVAQTKVLQQQAEVRSLQRDLLDLERARKLEENRLAVLLGRPPGSVRVPAAPLTETVRAPAVPVGLPSDLLARRPDILAAEYRVLKAHELIGITRLAKLPSIGLSGSGGLASAALSGLLSGWSLGLGLAVKLPIFDPTIDLRIKGSEIQHRVSEDEYRKTVIQAFEEVEAALINLASRKQQARELEAQIKALDVVNRQTLAQLREGMVSQLDVLESERSLLSARQNLLSLKHEILKDTITLYKVLGGGWPKQQVTLADS